MTDQGNFYTQHFNTGDQSGKDLFSHLAFAKKVGVATSQEISPLTREQNIFASKLQALTNTAAEAINGLSPEAATRMHSIATEINHVIDLRDKHTELARKRNTGDGDLGHYEWAVFIGSGLLIKDKTDKLETEMVNEGLGNVFRPTRQIVDFSQTPEITMEVGGYSLGKLYDEDGQGRDIKLVSRFKFLLATISQKHPTFDSSKLTESFPLMTDEQGTRVISTVSALVGIALRADSPHEFLRHFEKFSRYETFLTCTENCVERLKQTRELLVDALLSPDNPDHESVRQILTECLAQADSQEISNAIDLMTLSDDNAYWIQKLYRGVKLIADSSDDKNFYSMLLKPLLEYAGEHYNVLPANRVDRFFTNVDMPVDPIELARLGPMAKEITERSSNFKYKLDPDMFSNLGTDRPKSVTVLFDKDQVSWFRVELKFAETEGDVDIAIEFTTNSVNGTPEIDWSILEATDDPRIGKIRDGIILISTRSLEEIKKSVDEQYVKTHLQPSNRGNGIPAYVKRGDQMEEYMSIFRGVNNLPPHPENKHLQHLPLSIPTALELHTLAEIDRTNAQNLHRTLMRIKSEGVPPNAQVTTDGDKATLTIDSRNGFTFVLSLTRNQPDEQYAIIGIRQVDHRRWKHTRE